MEYYEFIESKNQLSGDFGFEPVFMPEYLFDFQKHLVDWAVRKGRGAVFADCGLGKTPIQLVIAQNWVQQTNKRILIATPLSVAQQTVREAEKFGIGVERSPDGKFKQESKIIITNYERLHYFDPKDFIGMICDESSILKNFNGKMKKAITVFMRKLPYRLLCTATAAPNDYTELGTSSEALGYYGFSNMIEKFFKNTQNDFDTKGKFFVNGMVTPRFRFKGHSRIPFWRWISSWAKAVRKPSDIGFSDNDFILPELIENETVVDICRPLPGKLFPEPAVGLYELRMEREATLKERCESAAEKMNNSDCCVMWCNLNDEADLVEKLVPDSLQISGSMTDEKKEERFTAFSTGDLRKLIIKPKIGAFGLNWQHCNHTIFFPTHSYEQYYQGVRRFYRFGQEREVLVDFIVSIGEVPIIENLKRQASQADRMFSELIVEMNNPEYLESISVFKNDELLPEWI